MNDSRPSRGEGDSGDSRREGEDRGPSQRRGKGFFKKKVCKFCAQKLKIDYKDADVLR
ncbi:MAG TPA: 30S ribosomal protein S18, partial [Rectinemataceae bacterium]|nr:30S ribosomal protein S18 [Rectinemataceae bacterium]